MSKIVFVLGAGASAHTGTPLMRNFLDEARDLLRSGEVNEVAQDFKSVFNAIGYLKEVHSKAKINFNNIEAVFTAFEMGKLLSTLPRIKSKKNIDKLLESLKVVIGYTLERTMKLKQIGNTYSPSTYYAFIGIIDYLIKQNRDCAIITFNYDLGLDYSLHERKILLDYGLRDVDLENKSKVTLLKLHGSINWGVCSNKKCKQKILPLRQFQYTTYYPTEKYSIIPSVTDLNKGQQCRTCGHSLEKTPLIVPPTWNKTSFHGQIKKVWEKAANILKDAEDIVVIGYSLPHTDWFFNYLFALGVNMTTPAKGFYVYNYNDEESFERFKHILGQDYDGKVFLYNLKFEDAVQNNVAHEYGINIKTIPQIFNIKNKDSGGGLIITKGGWA